MPNKYIAEVIDNVDPLTQGRVQIYIPHLMENFNQDHYPWSYPDREGSSNIPEIGDKVWCWFEEEDYLKKPFYQNKVQFIDKNDADESIGSMTGSYPDIKYIKLKNGVAIGLNSNETEISILAGNTEIYIDPLGNISVSTDGLFQFKNKVTNLLTILNGILDAIIALNVTTPVGPSSVPLNMATFVAIKAQLALLMR
jgi:hypothetical protein